MLTHRELRETFTSFWKTHGHKEVPPIPLVPKDDPTTLFTGSGMQQLVPYLLGEIHPLGKRLYNIQPCIRAQDIDEVGDNRHDTFFEMMGNWSLGDYFKQEQLAWVWELMTEKLKLPKDKLYVTVFSGTEGIDPDQDAYLIWKKIGLPESKIFKYEGNWWSRAGSPKNMPAGEPGGPDSEIFYEFTQVKHDLKFGPKCHPNCDCGRFLEIGNSVFMQYKKMADGSFKELPAKNVDFGGGMERILAAANDNPDNFSTDLYLPIIRIIEKETGKKYADEINKPPMRIIADHIRSAVFLIKNGVYPANKEQGYVLRRLLRQSMIKMRQLKNELPSAEVFAETCRAVLLIYENIYFDVEKDMKLIKPVIEEETVRFSRTLEKGLRELEKYSSGQLNALNAFNLFQTYGFPFEISSELFEQKGINLDRKEFDAVYKKHQELSRKVSTGMFKGGLADHSEQVIKYHTTTHLLHQALFDVLGLEIKQEGSNITNERLRFDFSAKQKPLPEQIKEVERIVNEKIIQSLPVESKILPKEEAQKLGAKSFFREKYPDMVKVYFIGSYSKEFCGGPHVKNTKEIGSVSIFKFEKIGSNLYRVYAK